MHHVSWVAFIRDDLDLLREEIAEKCAEGFTAFKLKVGVDIELDEQRLEVMRRAAGPGASIKIDPNGGWKGRGVYATYGADAAWHVEGGPVEPGNLVRFQIRPHPLAN